MGEGIMKKVTNGDIGGGGVKFCIFAVTVFMNGPFLVSDSTRSLASNFFHTTLENFMKMSRCLHSII